MVDLTKKKTATEYPTAKLLNADTVFTYRPTNAVGEKVFRGIITGGTAASIAIGTSTDLKMYSDAELKSAISAVMNSETEIWTGSEASVDLTALPGGYPGDGLYRVVYNTSKSTTIYFKSGIACFQSAESSDNGFSLLSVDAVEKDASDVVTANKYREGGSIVLMFVNEIYKIGI